MSNVRAFPPKHKTDAEMMTDAEMLVEATARMQQLARDGIDTPEKRAEFYQLEKAVGFLQHAAELRAYADAKFGKAPNGGAE